jgi:hypothetical protein
MTRPGAIRAGRSNRPRNASTPELELRGMAARTILLAEENPAITGFVNLIADVGTVLVADEKAATRELLEPMGS